MATRPKKKATEPRRAGFPGSISPTEALAGDDLGSVEDSP